MNNIIHCASALNVAVTEQHFHASKYGSDLFLEFDRIPSCVCPLIVKNIRTTLRETEIPLFLTVCNCYQTIKNQGICVSHKVVLIFFNNEFTITWQLRLYDIKNIVSGRCRQQRCIISKLNPQEFCELVKY